MLSRFRDKKVDRDWLESNFPCMMACPAGTNAGRYVAFIAEGRFEEAYRCARDPNPMASISPNKIFRMIFISAENRTQKRKNRNGATR